MFRTRGPCCDGRFQVPILPAVHSWPRCGALHDCVQAQGSEVQAYLVFELHRGCAEHEFSDEYHCDDGVAIGHGYHSDKLYAAPTAKLNHSKIGSVPNFQHDTTRFWGHLYWEFL